MSEITKKVADLADELYSDKITYEQFIDAIPDEILEDEVVSELIYMIEHEPKVGGFLGVSEAEGDKYRAGINALIEKLRQ
jgi:hypothetical protein